MLNERTPLRTSADSNPPYVFMTNPHRAYGKKIRQFQCCICTVVMGLSSALVLLVLLYSLEPEVPPSSETLLTASWPIEDETRPISGVNTVSGEDVEEAIEYGEQEVRRKEKEGVGLKEPAVGSPVYMHQRAMSTGPRATQLARIGQAINSASLHITRKHDVESLRSCKVPKREGWLPEDWCDGSEACPRSPYRSIDGSCNNLDEPSMWGVALRPFRRMVPPDYCDGISSPRCSSDGGRLPSAREISLTVHRPLYRHDEKFTVMLAVWGQFIDHDITATALSKGEDGKGIDCCPPGGGPVHPECFPVEITAEDPHYHQYNVTCMHFVRSAPSPTCFFGPREQMNQVSSYLDGSVVYGNTEEMAKGLRSFERGRLRMSNTPDGRSLLPISTDLYDGCNREEENAKGRYCFESGDPRANENLHLTSLHLLMAREHNRLATELADLNPHWDDEKIYQESRKIVSAEIQHVTYNEFLPMIFGKRMMASLSLSPKESGYDDGYSKKTDPSVSNSFATAAFRFAHTLIPGLMKILANKSETEYVELHKMLFNPYSLYKTGGLDATLKGAMATHLQRSDSYFTKELTQKLFQTDGPKNETEACGLDLVSLNIQRGRDHGLPAYTKWRSHCRLTVPKTFSDLKTDFDQDSLDRISKIYKSVDDVDLYTGALAEVPVEGGLLGPTAMCILADQFKRIKIGDRFWYETSEKPQAFTPDQLESIKRTSLARIICDNSDEVDEIDRWVMTTSEKVGCDQLGRIELAHWKSTNTVETGTKNGPPNPLRRLKVKSGTVYMNGRTVWSGTLPVTIPTSVVYHRVSGQVPPFVTPFVWEATSVSDTRLEGTFNTSEFSLTPFPRDFSVIPQTGKFSFDVDPTSVKLSQMVVTGKKYFSKLKFISFAGQNARLQSDGSGIRAPVLLLGEFSTDGLYFTWDGTVALKTALVSAPTTNKALKTMTGSGLKLKSPGRTIKVTSGSIDLNGWTVWSGTLPLTIPTSVMYHQNGQVPSFVSPFVWEATLVSDTRLEGTFNTSEFSLTPFPRDFSVIQQTGKFSFDVDPTSVKLSQIVVTGKKYVSKIKLINFAGQQNAQLQSDGSEIRAPVLLVGEFSMDGLSFTWDGTVALKTAFVSAPQVKSEVLDAGKKTGLSLKSPGKTIKVTSGSIDMNGRTVWSGTLPLTIPTSVMYHQNGQVPSFVSPFVWEATFVSDTRLEGTFNTSEFSLTPFPRDFSVMEQTGKFSFDLDPSSVKLSQIVVTGKKYVSKIKLINFAGQQSTQLQSDGSEIRAPVLLVGEFSVDGLSFTWDGTVALKTALVSATTESKALKTMTGSGIGLKLPGRTIKVKSGSIDMNGRTVWSGTLPVTIPTSVMYHQTGQVPSFVSPFVWEATLVSDTRLEGMFNTSEFSLTPFPRDFSVIEQTGKFSFDVDPSSVPLSGMVVTGKRYVTKIKFVSFSARQSSVESDTRAPVLLIGNFAPGGLEFTWNGDVFFGTQGSPGVQVGGSVRLVEPFEGTVWSGEIPAEIPVSAFPNAGKLSHEVKWSARLTGEVLAGSFRLTHFLEGTLPFKVWKGSFDLSVGPDYVDVSRAFTPGVEYVSRVVFHGTDDASMVLVTKTGLVHSPVVLKGVYSPDVSTFYWSGRVYVDAPKMSPQPLLKIEGGQLNLSNRTVWSGQLPLNLSLDLIYGNSSLVFPVVWEPTLISESKIKGNFEITRPKKMSGEFSLDISPGSELQVVEGVKYESKIKFITSREGEAPESPNRLPVLLVGEFGKGYFTWGGQVLLGAQSPKLLSSGPRFRVRATKGYVQVGGSVVWDGETPGALPLGAFGGYPKRLEHTVRWSGTLVGNNLAGRFAIEEWDIEGIASTTLEGEFSFELEATHGLENTFDPDTVYSSRLVFGSRLYETNDVKSRVILEGASSGETFYWSGIVTFEVGSPKLTAGKDDKKPKLEKLFASIMVTGGRSSASLDGGPPVEIFQGDFPTAIYLDNIKKPDSYAPLSVKWVVAKRTNGTLTGNFSLASVDKKVWSANFSIDVELKYGGSLDIIIPDNEYECNLIFQPGKQSSLLGKTPDDVESCTVILSGYYYEKSVFCAIVPWWCSDDTIFYWSGYGELMIRKPGNTTLLASKAVKPKNKPFIGNFVTAKVAWGEANLTSGSEDINVPLDQAHLPVSIQLDRLIDRETSYKRVDLTFSTRKLNATNSLQGEFTIKSQTVDPKTGISPVYKGNFSVRVVPKWSGNIDFIVPDKVYTCSLVFRATTKSDSSKAKLRATGEICSLTMMGEYKQPSFFCSITPWWCSYDTVFYWSGDISLSIKIPISNNTLTLT